MSVKCVTRLSIPGFMRIKGQNFIYLFLKTLTFSPAIFRTHLGSEFHRLHAVQAKERSLAFVAFPLIGKVGIFHLHPCLTCMLKVKPFFFDMFETISSFILYMYIILNLSFILCIQYNGFLSFSIRSA